MVGDNRERGFIVLHRRIRSSALYQSLTGEQRIVMITVLLLANWKARSIWHAGGWITVERGEFAHSLETVAREAGVSIKVVRTTYTKLLADDSDAGGRGSFLIPRWTGTETGRGLRILRIRHYDEYQRIDDEEGTETGTGREGDGARQGHASGTTGAPREPVKPDQPCEPERESSAAPPPSLSPDEVLTRLSDEYKGTRGTVYGWASPKLRQQDLDAAAGLVSASGGDLDEIVVRWVTGLLNQEFPRIDTVADLARFWPRFAPSPSEARARLRQQREIEDRTRFSVEVERRRHAEGGAP